MPRPYPERRLLYPPRTERLINPGQLGRFRGFIAQYKYNDIRTLIYVHPDGQLELTTRQREAHREYRLTAGMERNLRGLGLRGGLFHVLDGGILRFFEGPLGNPLILWDILVHEGSYLTDTTYRSRYELLRKLCREPSLPERESGHALGLAIAQGLWLAQNFTEELRTVYELTLNTDLLEGLMLKSPLGRLEPGYREQNNGDWQLKVRKPATAYRF